MKKYNEPILRQMSTAQFLKAVNTIFEGTAIYETKKKQIVYYGDMDYSELTNLIKRGY